MNQKGFANVVLIVLVIVLAGATSYLFLTRNPAQQKQPTTPTSSTQNSASQAPTPTPVVEKPIVPSSADSPRVISCNPRRYDPESFKREKPCVSDMTAVDIERENKAISIINKAIAAKSPLRYVYSGLPQLFVSDKRYQLIEATFVYVVVDTVGGKVTDYFTPFNFVEESPKRWVFLDSLNSQGRRTGDSIRQYTFGKRKSVTLSATEVYYPQTYYYFDGPMGSTGVKVLSSTPNSITLGIYDYNKPLPQKPGDDFVEYKQVGTKVINLAE